MQNKVAAKVRSALVMEIFKKSLLLPYENARESAAVSLMSRDIDGIVNGIAKTFDIIMGSVEAGFGAYMVANLIQDAAQISYGIVGRKFIPCYNIG